jgi:hypothetical protein
MAEEITLVSKQQQIDSLTKQVRALQEELALYKHNFGNLADLVNDAASDIKLGRELAAYVRDGLINFQWQENN